MSMSKLKAEGLRTGFPDLMLMKNGKILFIEMKRKRGGVVSKTQIHTIERLRYYGFETKICKGFEDAKNAIDRWLE